MSHPIAICIENIGRESGKTRYMQCVALPGRQLGLSLDETGKAMWKSADSVSCELWVSADERLILYRPSEAVNVSIRRSGRTLDVPYDKPVVIIDKDEIEVDQQRLRIHMHGQAKSVSPPTAFDASPKPLGIFVKAAAAATVLGAISMTGCSDGDKPDSKDPNEIEVREEPPEVDVDDMEP